MNNGFLANVATNIISKYSDFYNLEIIIPNRRTGLFLKKFLCENIKHASWLPKITTIQDLFFSKTELIQAEDLLLINYLHKEFVGLIGENESLDQFYYWGEIILSDFDDIDKYLVDSNRLFETLKEINEIDAVFSDYNPEELEIIKRFWGNVISAKDSLHKEKFLNLWEKMSGIYQNFTSELKKSGIGYQGLIYRDVIEGRDNLIFEDKKYVVVGFNALNKCEIEMFKSLSKNCEVDFFWDADNHYIKDGLNEAGRFLRDNLKLFKQASGVEISSEIEKQKSDVEVIMVPSPISQLKLIEQILNDWKKEDEENGVEFKLENIAIVLGDEELLIPLMYSMPDYYPYNITMGFSVKNSSSYGFLYHLIMLLQNAKYYDNKLKFYYKDVIAILNHVFIKSKFKSIVQTVLTDINKNNLFYIDADSLFNKDAELINSIFCISAVEDVKSISEYVENIANIVFNLILEKSDTNSEMYDFEEQLFYKIKNRITLLNGLIRDNEINFDSKSLYFKLLLNSLKSISVAFEGEPLEGIQMLGFLETRNLDFERVIMLSMNEGVFPKKTTSQTMLPYNVRKFYKLPSIEYQDSIFAYYFYRLMQRSKSLKILYSAQLADVASEVSRFVLQLKYELNSDNRIKFTNKGYQISLSPVYNVLGEKSDYSLQVMRSIFEKGISPKAINEYLNCKFRFYLNYIEQIKESETVEEDVDSAVFGKLFHSVMQALYEPYLESKSIIGEKEIQDIYPKIDKALASAIKQEFNLFNQKEIDEYSNKIISNIVVEYVKRTLDYDKMRTPFQIIGLEDDPVSDLIFKDVNTNEDIQVNLKGYIDRIDRRGSLINVIDYKTGTANNKVKKIEDLFSETRDTDCNIITQLLLYSLIVSNNNSSSKLVSTIYNVNELDEKYIGDIKVKINEKDIRDSFDDELKNIFLENLRKVFTDMFDKSSNFIRTSNLKSCEYCLYKLICNRDDVS